MPSAPASRAAASAAVSVCPPLVALATCTLVWPGDLARSCAAALCVLLVEALWPRDATTYLPLRVLLALVAAESTALHAYWYLGPATTTPPWTVPMWSLLALCAWVIAAANAHTELFDPPK